MAIDRVKERVRLGGHNVPEETIQRRYNAGLENFFKLYRNLAKNWWFYDNSGSAPQLICYSLDRSQEYVVNPDLWNKICEEGKYGI